MHYTGGMDEKPVSRRSILAVWHWPRWVWCVISALPIVYLLSAAPVRYGMAVLGISNHAGWITAYNTVYWTHNRCTHYVAPLRDLDQWELGSDESDLRCTGKLMKPDALPPPQPSVFAVWRWRFPKWTWGIVVPLMVA